MPDPNDGVAGLVFQKAIRRDLGELALDGNMVSVLMALDGEKNLRQVSQQVGFDLSTLKVIVAKLVKLNLVERVEVTVNPVDREFLTYLLSQLSAAMGPMAKFAIEDALKTLGFTQNAFPAGRSVELVGMLAKEIQRPDKRLEFKDVMLKKIREKGY